MSKHQEEYRDRENRVQLAHDLVEERETQHRKITGKFHAAAAKGQTGKTHGGWGEEAS